MDYSANHLSGIPKCCFTQGYSPAFRDLVFCFDAFFQRKLEGSVLSEIEKQPPESLAVVELADDATESETHLAYLGMSIANRISMESSPGISF